MSEQQSDGESSQTETQTDESDEDDEPQQLPQTPEQQRIQIQRLWKQFKTAQLILELLVSLKECKEIVHYFLNYIGQNVQKQIERLINGQQALRKKKEEKKRGYEWMALAFAFSKIRNQFNKNLDTSLSLARSFKKISAHPNLLDFIRGAVTYIQEHVETSNDENLLSFFIEIIEQLKNRWFPRDPKLIWFSSQLKQLQSASQHASQQSASLPPTKLLPHQLLRFQYLCKWLKSQIQSHKDDKQRNQLINLQTASAHYVSQLNQMKATMEQNDEFRGIQECFQQASVNVKHYLMLKRAEGQSDRSDESGDTHGGKDSGGHESKDRKRGADDNEAGTSSGFASMESQQQGRDSSSKRRFTEGGSAFATQMFDPDSAYRDENKGKQKVGTKQKRGSKRPSANQQDNRDSPKSSTLLDLSLRRKKRVRSKQTQSISLLKIAINELQSKQAASRPTSDLQPRGKRKKHDQPVHAPGSSSQSLLTTTQSSLSFALPLSQSQHLTISNSAEIGQSSSSALPVNAQGVSGLTKSQSMVEASPQSLIQEQSFQPIQNNALASSSSQPLSSAIFKGSLTTAHPSTTHTTSVLSLPFHSTLPSNDRGLSDSTQQQSMDDTTSNSISLSLNGQSQQHSRSPALAHSSHLPIGHSLKGIQSQLSAHSAFSSHAPQYHSSSVSVSQSHASTSHSTMSRLSHYPMPLPQTLMSHGLPQPSIMIDSTYSNYAHSDSSNAPLRNRNHRRNIDLTDSHSHSYHSQRRNSHPYNRPHQNLRKKRVSTLVSPNSQNQNTLASLNQIASQLTSVTQQSEIDKLTSKFANLKFYDKQNH